MKKTTIIVLALVLALTTLCAACGGSNAPTTSPTEAPETEATEIPTVTAPPEDQPVDNIVAADDNSAPEQKTSGDAIASMGEQQQYVEQLAGEPVQALYDYMGEPKSKEYTTSCMVMDAEDGILYYDGFYVCTLKYSDDEEYIMSTGN